MSEDEDFAALFEQSPAASGKSGPGKKRLTPGKVVDGVVVASSEDTIFVDVGTRSEGVLERRAGDVDWKVLPVGERIRVTVIEHARPDAAPKLALSLRGGAGLNADALAEAAREGTPVEGEFTKAVKAGIEVDLGGVRGFCPASHVEIGYAGDLETYVGQRHFFRVLDVKDGGRSVVVSRRALLEAEREAKATALGESLAEGMDLDGIVQSVQPYGAFVDIGGLTGLVHVSEIAHGRVASPSDVVAVGEKVRVRVLSITWSPAGPPGRRTSAESGTIRDAKISLSMRVLTQPPPDAGGAGKDEVITATVNKVESFGILVDTPAGSGLVPNAELALPKGSDPRRAYAPGDTLNVVTMGSGGSGRMRFSARAVEEVEARKAFQQFSGKSKERSLGSLGELLAGKVGELPDRPTPKDPPKRR